MIDLITHEGHLLRRRRRARRSARKQIPAEYAAEVEEVPAPDARSAGDVQRRADGDCCWPREEPSDELIHKVTKHAVQQQDFTPVFMGSAYKNKGVQLLLDAIVRYLPVPLEREVKAKKWDDPTQTLAARARSDQAVRRHGVQDRRRSVRPAHVHADLSGQRSTRAKCYFNQRTGRKERFSRIVKMHADKREEIDAAEAGDIVAIMGIDCASGDTYASETKYCTLESMFVPEPVIKMAITPVSRDDADKLSKALQRFRKEDPTFRVFTDEETSETIIAGMGELHLEIYVERIRREYKVEVEVGAPKVSYREAPDARRPSSTTSTRSRPAARASTPTSSASLEPLPEDVGRELRVRGRGHRRPHSEGIHSLGREGLPRFARQGPAGRVPDRRRQGDARRRLVSRRRSARTWRSRSCAEDCFRETFLKTKPVLLEPIMKVEIEVPRAVPGRRSPAT